jgi:hypothetical protein
MNVSRRARDRGLCKELTDLTWGSRKLTVHLYWGPAVFITNFGVLGRNWN